MKGRTDFHGINRVMRSGRLVASRAPLMGGMHLAPSEAAVIDEKFSADDTPADAERKINRVIAQVNDLTKRRAADKAEIDKIAVDIAAYGKVAEKHDELAAKVAQAHELALAAAGTVPGDGKMNARAADFLRSFSRGPKPDRELHELARAQSDIPSAYFHLITKTGRFVKASGAPEEIETLLARLRQMNDVIFMLNKYFSVKDPGTYQQLGGMKGLAVWKEWEELCKRVQLADLAEGGSTTGGAWVPTIWSGNLIQLVQIMARSENYFEHFPMQSNLQKGFVEGADMEAYYISEAGEITQSDFTTFDATWTARKLAARTRASREVTQDSAIPLTQEIERKSAKALARGTEKVIVNAQSTGTTPGGAGSLDTGETIAAGDARLLTNGVRYWHAQCGTGVVDASAGLTIEQMAKVRGPMGAYGIDPSEMIWLCSAWGAAHILTVKNAAGNPILLGPRSDATSPRGTVGSILDSDIVLSAYVPDNMNSSGVIDGAGDRTAIYYVNVEQFKIGERLGVVVEASTHERFSYDQIVFKAIRRLDFQPVRTPSASDPMVGAIGNLQLA